MIKQPNILNRFFILYRGAGLAEYQVHFNKIFSGARVVIENAFGLLVARFRILSKKMEVLPENAKKITMSCCILHNMLIDQLTFEEINSWREVSEELNLVGLHISQAAGHGTKDGRTLREKLARHFYK